jgi:hypothetical protein
MEDNRFKSHDFLVGGVVELLAQYEQKSSSLSLREQTRLLVQVQETVRQLGVAVGVRAGFSATGARQRILDYLRQHPNEVIDGMELAVISGISEYGRRIREIRGAGFEVLSGADGCSAPDGTPLRPDQYVLVTEFQPSDQKPFRD